MRILRNAATEVPWEESKAWILDSRSEIEHSGGFIIKWLTSFEPTEASEETKAQLAKTETPPQLLNNTRTRSLTLLHTVFALIASIGLTSTVALCALDDLSWVSPASNSVLRLNHEYPLIATTKGGLPVSFRVQNGPGIAKDGSVTATNLGTIVLEATTAGDAAWMPLSETRKFNQSSEMHVERLGVGLGGDVRAVQVVDHLAFAATGSGLKIFDVGSPMTPILIGSFSNGSSDTYNSIHVAGGLAYVAHSLSGLKIINVSDPRHPQLLANYITSSPTADIQIYTNLSRLAYIADGNDGLTIINSNLPQFVNQTNPRRVGGLRLNGFAAGIEVFEDLAYVASGRAGLHIVDVGDPQRPGLSGWVDIDAGFARSVRVVDSIGYLACGSAGLNVVDVNKRRIIGNYHTGGVVEGVYVENGVAYLADGMNGLTVVDVNNPVNPHKLGSLDTDGFAEQVQVVWPLAYVADGSGGLQILRLREGRVGQVIEFNPPPSISITNRSIILSGTAGSGLPVSFSIVSGPATIDGNQLSFDGSGTVVIRATQAGNEQFLPVSVDRVTEVTKAPQQITWISPSSSSTLRWNREYTLLATANSSLPVTFRVESGPATITAGAVTVTNLGSVVLVAEQVGTSTYEASIEYRTFNRSDMIFERLGEWPGYPRGEAHEVQVVGELAYVAIGQGGLAIFDVSNPAAPMRVGGFDALDYSRSVQVVDGVAYLTDGEYGVQIVDVTDPANPKRLGGFDTGGYAIRVKVVGKRAYLADSDSGFHIVDVSLPANPVRLGGYDTPGEACDVAVVNDVAYVADGFGGLQIYGIQDPVNPISLGSSQNGGFAWSIDVLAMRAYVAAQGQGGGLHIVDISSPAQPEWLGTYHDFGWLNDVQVIGGLAYIAGDREEFQIVDVSNPRSPVRIGGRFLDGAGYGVYVAGRMAYVADWENGLHILDIGVIAAPTAVGKISTIGFAQRVQVIGNIAYVADEAAGLQIVDVRAPANPERIGQFDSFGFTYGIQVVGTSAYLADWDEGIQIVDVSNPAEPYSLGRSDTSGVSYAVHVQEKVAYVADEDEGLKMIDISDAAFPSTIGRFNTEGEAFGLSVMGTLAFIADGSAGLQIIDVNNPSNPFRLGRFDTDGTAYSVQVVGSIAYVADGQAGLVIIDVSNPAKPIRVGSYDTIGRTTDVRIVGAVAFLADTDGGFIALDVGDPAAPTHLGGYRTSGWNYGICVTGDKVYLANDEWGIEILSLRYEKIRQVLACDIPASATLADSPLLLTCTASSELPVFYSVVSGPATVAGNQLTLTGAGAVVLRVEQVGNEQFQSAFVERTIHVGGLPTLRVQAAEGVIYLSWQSRALGHILEFTEDLAADSSWRPENAIPFDNGETRSVAIPSGQVTRFYRLRGL